MVPGGTNVQRSKWRLPAVLDAPARPPDRRTAGVTSWINALMAAVAFFLLAFERTDDGAVGADGIEMDVETP